MSKRIYIAGPMSGYPNWNYDAFHAAAKKLRAEGWIVHSPAENDIEEGMVDEDAKPNGDTELAISNGTFDFRRAYMWDLTMIVEGDAIYMLPGWEMSPGARGEHAVAVAMKKNYPDTYQILYQES